MKKYLTLAIILMIGFIAQAQVESPEQKAMQEMKKQMDEMAIKMKAMELQMESMRQPEMVIDTSIRKVIVINGETVDTNSSPEDIEVLRNLKKITDGGDNIRVLETEDSVIVNVGKFQLRVTEDENNNNEVILDRIETETIDSIGGDDDKDNKTLKISGGSFRIGVNNYLYDNKFKTIPGYTDLELLTGKSINVGIGLVDARVKIIKKNLTFHTQLMLDINNYRFSSDNILLPKSDSVKFIVADNDKRITKNKLNANYLVVPVSFQYCSGKDQKKSFKMGAGARIGYLIGSHTKTVVDDNKSKERDDFNLNPFKYGLTFNIGYGWLNFYVDYDFTPLFKNGVAPNLTPVQAGLILANF